jgi:hypothetical protein
MPPHIRFAPLTAFVFSHKVAALAAGTVVLIVLGCMSLNIGPQTNEDGTVTQDDTVSVPANSEIEVFYPIPYVSPPHLIINEWHDDCVVTEQKENHFRIRNRNNFFARSVSWTARGIRVPAAVVVPPQGSPDGPPVARVVPLGPPDRQPQGALPPAPVPVTEPSLPPAQLGQPR